MHGMRYKSHRFIAIKTPNNSQPAEPRYNNYNNNNANLNNQANFPKPATTVIPLPAANTPATSWPAPQNMPATVIPINRSINNVTTTTAVAKKAKTRKSTTKKSSRSKGKGRGKK